MKIFVAMSGRSDSSVTQLIAQAPVCIIVLLLNLILGGVYGCEGHVKRI